MARRTRSGTAARQPLTRERVLRAALAFADERSLEELSMRKLAQGLGVEAMSLYNHVESKDDIVSGMVALVVDEIEAPSPGGDWKAEFRKSAISAHEALSRHRWAATVWMSSGGRGGDRMQHAEAALRCLREAGFSKDLTYHAFHVWQGYALGFTLQELNFPHDRESLKEMAATFLREFPTDEFPYLAEHIEQHIEPPLEEHQGAFEFGLDLILDRLEHLRDAAAQERP
jgi:AcrR family transcriptional regulator